MRVRSFLDATSAAMEGKKLSAQSAQNLEDGLKSNPDDLEARSKLLGYYFMRSHLSESDRANRHVHLLWLIRNRPDAPILRTSYVMLIPGQDASISEETKKAWLEQVGRRPRNTSLLGAAAGSLVLYDSATAEKLYKRAEAAAPQNHIWPKHLGLLYKMFLTSKKGEDRVAAAADALDAYERSLQRVKNDHHREVLLCSVLTVAFEAGELMKAADYAEQVLKRVEAVSREHWNYGNMVHHAHLTLGRIALRNGDKVAAKQQLLAAGDTPGSPQLNSFGPNMTLAKEFLEQGESEVVLDYFKRCANFWNKKRLDAWSFEVRQGQTPQFGPNLSY